MAAMTPHFYRNEKHQKSQVHELIFVYQITAAKTVVPVPRGLDALITFDGLTQQQIDDYLTRPLDGYVSTASSGFTAAMFDATAMGANYIGGVINMNQQAAFVSFMSATLITGGTGVTNGAHGTGASLTASTAVTEVGISPSGDIGFKAALTGLDAATSGAVIIRIGWVSK